jgi:amino acid adenylation domain-containing protein
VANPAAAVASLRLLRAEDERRLLYGWNDTCTEFPRELVHELFARQVERTPNHTAVIFQDVSLTFLELNRRSNLLATHLQGMGVGPDTVVGVMLERSLEMLVGVLGVLKAGGAYLPLDPEYPAERLQFMLADAAVPVLLTQKHLAHNIAAEVEIIRLDDVEWDWDAIGAQAEENPRAAVTGDNLAYLIYTSGSTGKPKGVAMRHGPMANLVQWQMRRSGEALRTVQFTSLSFDVSFQEIFSTLCAGATLVLLREETRRDAGALLQLLISERIERLFVPFVALQYFAEAAERQQEFPTTLRQVTVMGEQLKITRHIRSLFAKLEGCTLDNHYGPSETHVISAFRLDGEVADWPELPAIGQPIANTQMYLLDERMQPVPMGAAGELYIGGDALARGYLNRAEATAEKFLPDPFTVGGSRLYRTGDRGRYLADGNIEFLERRDHQVKVRGFRVELGEIEAALMEQETVREAAVTARAESREEKRLVAYVVSEGGVEVNVEVLRQALRAKLPDYMVPGAIVVLKELPLTPSGKINRRALPAPESVFAAEYEAPRTLTEELLCGIWASVLRVSRVGINENFFELGGHSLMATQLVSRVREAFAVELPLRELFARPTVASLAEQVEVALRGGLGVIAPPLARVSREQELPLSHAQQRLWFLDQLEPGSATYNLPGAVRLQGQLDVEVLERTLDEVVRRHEVLRTTFVAVNGEPVQVIAPASQLRLPVLDLSELPEEQREREARLAAQAEAARPFDLSAGPLLRVQLLRLGAEDHLVLFTVHHIISDGWSTGILVREVAALYEAYVAGRESPLPELEIQYADYAVWQREWLQGEVLEQQLAYWRQQLEELPVLQLPADRPRPLAPSHQGRTINFNLPAELTAELKRLSNTEGVTLYMTLLAAFKILLWRYSGQRDLVVGTPIAGRNQLATEGLIGFFVNTLVLHTEIRVEENFRALLTRVREIALGAYAHQDVPFEKLVEELHADRQMSATPLFQVMFVFLNVPMDALELAGLTLRNFEIENKLSTFDLTLSAYESGPELAFGFEYNTDLFDETTIVRMGAHLQLLLERIVAEPEQQLSALSLLSAAEEHQLLREWNETSTEYPRDLCVHQLFEAQVLRTPENVAVSGDDDDELTYAELNRRANQLAHYLKQLGVGPETRVAILMERSLEMMVSVWAVLKAGGAYVPLDRHYPEELLRWIVSDSQSTLLLTHQRLGDSLPALEARVLCVDSEAETIAQQEECNPEFSMDVENLAYLIYTSGSTGQPKAVAVAHRSLVNYVTYAQGELGLTANDRMLQFASLSFDTSAEEIFPTLTTGARLVLRASELPGAAAFIKMCAEREITVLDLPTAYWNELATNTTRADWEAAAKLRVVIIGGEKARPETVQQFRERVGPQVVLKNGYGPTETTIVATFAELVSSADGVPDNREVAIGRPINNATVYVLDQQMQLVPIGVVGELYVGGAGVARGYLNRPHLTAARFVPNPFSAELGARLYRTGDLARYRADGQLEFLGRADSQVKVRGFRIELGEIETVLRAHPAVREAIVIATEVAPDDKRLVAYVVTAQSGASGTELREYLRRRLPEYMVPVTFVKVAEFPMTASGKIDWRALPAPDGIDLEQAYQAPRTQTEELLSGLFARVLRVPRVGVHDNFFELGGHSLLATQLVSRVREAFAVELPLRELFVRPTVAGLAEQVEAEVRGGVRVTVAPLVPVSREQELPLSHAQQRLWFLDQLDPGSVTYNIPEAVRLQGRLDVEALERTLNEVVRRHEVLRTTFVAVNGESVQVIAPPSRLGLPVLDLSELPEGERGAAVDRLTAAEAQRPFDLSAGPLLRVQLLRLDAEDHVVLFTVHHIISDGWSTGILVREVAALYEAYVAGRESPLPELEIQYADYAVWQREWLQGEVLEQQLAYWRQQLAELPVLQLPTDKPRPPVPSHQGRAIGFSVPAELTAELKRLSHTEGVTLYMTLLAAFKILLWRYSGQSDVVVGTPIAGRNHLATEELIGLFVNTLVLRTDLSGNPSFSELLERIREVTLGAYAHQDLPFEKLVEELQPERDMSRSPLFQVMFMLENATAEILRLPGLDASEVSGGDETAKFDLTLGLAENDGALYGSLQYRTDLFEAARIERLVQHYQLLLEGIAGHADRPLSELPLLLEEDRHKLLMEWNDTQVAFAHDKCVPELFEEQVGRRPGAAAVMYEDEQLTYAELNARANQLAHYLQAVGVGPEVPVGVLLERSPDTIVTLLGIFKAGGAYVPLDPEYPDERLRFMMGDAGVELIVTQAKLASRLADTVAKSIRVDADWPENESEDNPPLSATPSSLAYVIYTSGSSGKPKGAMVTHGGVVNCLQWMQQRYELTEQDAFLMHTSLNFDPSVWEVFWPLLVGGRVVVAPAARMLDRDALRYMAEQKVTCAYFVPSLLGVLVKEELSEWRSLRYVISGGEKLPLPVMREFQKLSGAELHHSYGPTETAIAATEWTCEAGAERVLMGKAIGNTQLYVLDQQMELLPLGVAGELYIGGAGVGRGYAGRAELTAERFAPDRFSGEAGARLYRTGDLVRYDEDGNLEFLGRVDDQVKLRGYRIELGEIEAVLRRHERVSEAVVELNEERLVAYVVSDAQAGELRAYLKAQLPDYMVPSFFVALKELPLLPNGKINRRGLPAPYPSTTSDSLTTPRDVLELQLVQIWKEVLGREQIGLRDNFFDLGGHSLLAVRLIDKIERLVGQKMSLSILFQGATIEQLAGTLRQHGGQVREQSLVHIQPVGSRPPLFLVHPASGNVMSYVRLARQLGREQPVYGLQSRGLDPDRKPTPRVEDMASEYLAELLAVQPDGPYFLGGWSMGGVIAFEMAQQLAAQGKHVGPLLLIDSYIHTGRVKKNGWDDVSLLLELAEHHGLFLDDVDHTLDALRSKSLDEQLEYLLEKGSGYSQFPLDFGILQLRHQFELFKVNVHAAQSYRPAKSEHQVILLQASDAPARQAATALRRWKKVAEVVEAQRLPGDHYSMLTEPNVTLVAEQINSYLLP